MAVHKKSSKVSSKADKKAAASAEIFRRRGIGALICFFLAVFTALSLFGVHAFFLNLLSGFLKGAVGRGFYVVPAALLYAVFILLFHRDRPVVFRLWCVLLVPVAVGAITHLFWTGHSYDWSWRLISTLVDEGLHLESGGLLSGLLAISLRAVISTVGAGIVLIVGLLFLLFSAFDLTLAWLVEHLRRPDRPIPPPKEKRPREMPETSQEKPERRFGDKLPGWAGRKIGRHQYDLPIDENVPGPVNPPPEEADPMPVIEPPEPVAVTPSRGMAFPVEDKAPVTVPAPAPARASDIPPWEPGAESPKSVPYRMPPLSLLAAGKPSSKSSDGTGELKINAARLLETIKSFGIEARIVSVTRGPTVARYELELDKGIKLSRLTGLSDDIALSLGSSGVRIAPVPGKMSVVGIEVPNKLTSVVYLRDVLASHEFTGQDSKIAFAAGKDIGGTSIVCDLSKLTHLLIAGTTGSGKSVCMNSLIVSLLYKAKPDEVRFVMIDPKMVELGVYNGIPHLEVPVVTDPKKAAGALYKVVLEMEDRYRKFMERHVRDIFSYNAAVADEPDTPVLPQWVVIIDELADLMLAAAKEVEESICRIAQKARAAGIHLVIATQRPSADVITGLMKANIPSRIAFAVASQLESRIILDTMGAEKLVGRGDMLLYPLGAPKPYRVQGCLITGAEVEEVVEYVKQSGEAQYSEEFIESIEMFAEQVGKKGGFASVSSGEVGGADAYDDLFMTAVEIVLESGQASVSFLQRRLKLGFSRAARLVDQMEERGIVGPSEGSKPRQLRITRQQWQEIQMRQQEME